MIRRARFKYMLIVFSIMSIVLIGVFSGVLASIWGNQITENNRLLDRMIEKAIHYEDIPGREPVEEEDGPPQHRQEMRSFEIIRNNIDGTVTIEFDDNFFTEVDVNSVFEIIKDKRNSSGYIDNTYYKTHFSEERDVFVGVDRAIELSSFRTTLTVVVIFGAVGLALLYIIFFALARWIFKPAEEAQEKQREFVADVSHELKTPITGIKLNLELLRKDVPNSKWLTHIENDSVRLEELTNELLYLNEIENNAQIYLEEINLSEFIEDELNHYEIMINKSDRTLKRNVIKGIVHKLDPSALKKVISILIKNAITHSDPNSEIEVSLKGENKNPVLSVFNKCSTIVNQDQEKLFERFYRGDKSRSRKTGGNGLGLSILKKLSDNNKWRIETNIQENVSFKITIRL